MTSFSFEFSSHAVERMLQRSISRQDVRRVIHTGVEIPGGSSSPRKLMFAFLKGRPLHVVLDDLSIEGKILVITAYEPDSKLWDASFTQRRDRSDDLRDLQPGRNPSRNDDNDT